MAQGRERGVQSGARSRIGLQRRTVNFWFKAAGENAVPRITWAGVSYSEKASDFRYPNHFHLELYELIYVDRGQMLVRVRGGQYTLGQGQALLLPPRHSHGTEVEPKHSVNSLVIQFAVSPRKGGLPDMAGKGPVIVDIGAEEFRLLREITELAQNPCTRSRRLILLALGTILCRISSPSPARQGQTGVERPGDYSAVVKEYIRGNYGRRLGLVEIARTLKCSVSRLCHEFHRGTGETPYRFLMRCRLERAKELLRQPGITVKQAASRSGFSSPRALARTFQIFERITPSTYLGMIQGRGR